MQVVNITSLSDLIPESLNMDVNRKRNLIWGKKENDRKEKKENKTSLPPIFVVGLCKLITPLWVWDFLLIK